MNKRDFADALKKLQDKTISYAVAEFAVGTFALFASLLSNNKTLSSASIAISLIANASAITTIITILVQNRLNTNTEN